MQNENDDIEAIGKLPVSTDEGAHSLSAADTSLTDGAAEGIDDEHLGAGFGDRMLQKLVAVLGIDGRQVVANEEGDELAAFLARAELVHGVAFEDGFFVGAPKNGAELNPEIGEGFPAGDGETEGGGEIGFARLGFAGEEAECSPWENALDDIGKVFGEYARGFDARREERVLEGKDGIGVGVTDELGAAHGRVNDVHHLYSGENGF